MAGSPGFFAGLKLPFGMSNVGTVPTPNPNFPSNQQLNNPPNPGADPRTTANANAGNNEPNDDPNNSADPNKGQGSQLDQFKDIFKIELDDKGNPIVPQDPMAGPITNVDPAKLREAAGKMNFTAGIQGELVAKALGGDAAALLQIINQSTQNAFTAALTANTGIVERSIQTYGERLESALPDRIRQTQIRQATPKNPVLNHPAAAPVVHGLKEQIARTNPNLSPDRVSEMAENYFLAMMKDMTANDAQTSQTSNKQSAETDWTALLGGPTS